MLKLLKRADTEKFGVSYYVKLFIDADNEKFTVYANNTDFNWGFGHSFETLEEAENDFYNTLKRFDFYKWEIK